MTFRYLLPARRQMENRMSIAAAGYGLWILLWNVFSEHNPIGWTGFEEQTRLFMANVFIWGGTIHWCGVYLNGGWQWSPALRVVGMTVLLVNWVILFLSVPHISSSAFLVYAYFSYRFGQANYSAITDLLNAFRGPANEGIA